MENEKKSIGSLVLLPFILGFCMAVAYIANNPHDLPEVFAALCTFIIPFSIATVINYYNNAKRVWWHLLIQAAALVLIFVLLFMVELPAFWNSENSG